MEEKISSIKEEISLSRRQLEEMNNSSSSSNNNSNNNGDADAEDAAKYELLVKRDQDMTSFMNAFESTKQSLVEEVSL